MRACSRSGSPATSPARRPSPPRRTPTWRRATSRLIAGVDFTSVHQDPTPLEEMPARRAGAEATTTDHRRPGRATTTTAPRADDHHRARPLRGGRPPPDGLRGGLSPGPAVPGCWGRTRGAVPWTTPRSSGASVRWSRRSTRSSGRSVPAAPTTTTARRLREVEVALDQCWDLLRQRRARRHTGEDPDAATSAPRTWSSATSSSCPRRGRRTSFGAGRRRGAAGRRRGAGVPMTYTQIAYEVADRVATITLDRPDRLNAFTSRCSASCAPRSTRSTPTPTCGPWW